MSASKDESKRFDVVVEASELAASAYTRSLIEASLDPLVTINPEGKITDVNRATELVTGIPRQRLIGTDFSKYFTEPEKAQEGYKQVFSQGSVRDYPLAIRHSSGRVTDVLYNAGVYKDASGKVQGVFAAARDITERKQAEDLQRAASAYARSLIEASLDPLVTISPEGKITDVNEASVKVTGMSREKLVGTDFSNYFTEPDKAREGYKQVFEKGSVSDYPLTIRHKSGKLTDVLYNASVYKDENGNVLGVFAAARDVTTQKQTSRYVRSLIEASLDPLVTISPEGKITDVNEASVKVTGIPREKLIGTDFSDYFTEPEKARQGYKQVFEKSFVADYPLTIRHNDGKLTNVLYNASVYKDEKGVVLGVFAAARDVTERKRAEERQRTASAYSRSLIEASLDPLVTISPEGKITDVNRATELVTGYPRQRLIGTDFSDYFTEPEKARDGYQQVFARGSVTDYPLAIRHSSGRITEVLYNASVYKDEEGNVQGVFAAARDVTQRKQAEDLQRAASAYARSLIEASVDPLVTINREGKITDVNKATELVTGVSRDQLVGSDFSEFFTEPEKAREGYKQVFEMGSVTDYPLAIRDILGRITDVLYNASVYKDDKGNVLGVFAAARVITEQKRLQEQLTQQYNELHETTSFLNNILESSTEYSIIAKDLNWDILTWNEGARRTYGYTAEEMVGKQNSRILHTPEDIKSGKVDEALSIALKTGKFEGEFHRIRKNGEQFAAQVAITLRRDANGNPIGYVLISKDITKQKVLEEQLNRKNQELEAQNRRVQEANRMKSEFLANMSHELRTPLNGIIGFAQLMHEGKAGPVSAQHKEFLGDILTSSRHLLQLINDVLDLAKVESGKMEFRPESVSMQKLVGEVRDILRTMAAGKRIEIATDIRPDTADIVADPSKLKQILYNYLSNALKFTPEGGKVSVRVMKEDGGQFRLEVEDTGIGIPPESIGRLFVEFQQLDASAAKKYQGTGLGLALTKRIVESQGGRVGVTSQPGHGSVFFAVLPLHPLKPAATRPVRVDAAATKIRLADGRPTVLVIDDDPKDLDWLQKTISKAGYSVTTASNGPEAIKLANEHRFDIITLDILLGGMNGQDILAAIRSRTKNQNTPVIVTTVVRDKGVVAGFHISDYLVKPIDPEKLLNALRRAGVATNGGGTKILVVDDDSNALKLACLALEHEGYCPICDSNALDGLRDVEKEHPSVVVLDLLMPGLDGFDFLSRLRSTKEGRKVPVIVWTVKDLTDSDRRRLETMAQKIVTKKEDGAAGLVMELSSLLGRS